MSIKEKDLPIVASLAATDYVRAVSDDGTSEIIQYSKLESDPVFLASPAGGITAEDIAAWMAPFKVQVFTTPSKSYPSGNTWVYSSDWHADAVPGYTAIGVLQGTPNSGGQGLISQIALNHGSYGDRFVGNVTNTTGSAITATIQVPVLYIRDELL